MRLSLCMIVKNEAKRLSGCLASVQNLVDEMIIVDTGSTDETVSIAQSWGAQVHHYVWNQNFAVARNESLQYATGDWILVLDADETLTPDSVPLIRQTIQQPNALVINLVRQEMGATQSPYSLVSRLFRRHPQVQFSRPYHAMVDDSVNQLLQQQPHWQILNLPTVAILHEGYTANAIAQRNKGETAKAAMEGFLKTHPHDPYVCSKLGALYVQRGEWQRGVALLERGIHALQQGQRSPVSAIVPEENAPTENAATEYELHYHLGLAYSRLRQLAQAEQHYRTAIQQPILDCLKLGAINNLGSLLQAKGDFSGAKATYESCLAIDPNFAMGHYNLGMVLKQLGQLTAALACYRQAIALKPDYAEAYQNLGVTLWKLGKVGESVPAFQRAIELHQAQNPQEADRLRRGLQDLGIQI